MNLNPKKRCKRVGVVSLLKAGKTVLLTSLLDHFENHDPQSLPIDDKKTELHIVKWHQGREIYLKHRTKIAHGDWLRKSDQHEEYHVELGSKQWWRRLDLTLLDMPGERLADIGIAKFPRYEEWSDQVLTALEIDREFQDESQPYFDLLAKPPQAEHEALREAFLREYRRVLARLILQCKPLVTPSSFLIDPQGHCAENDPGLTAAENQEDQIEYLVEHQYCGLDSKRQFAPLPAAVRDRQPALAAEFSRHYAAYRKQLVLPFACRLRTCNEILVPIDVAMLLEGGVGTFNTYNELLRQFIEYIDPGLNFWGKALSYLGRNRVEWVTFVATKADRVHGSDRDNLGKLLKQLCQPHVKARVAQWGLQVEYRICAAVKSVLSVDSENSKRLVQFYPIGSQGKRGEVKTPDQIEVSQLSDTWPDEWSPTEFKFPWAAPLLAKNRNNPPPHLGLDQVAEKLLS